MHIWNSIDYNGIFSLILESIGLKPIDVYAKLVIIIQAERMIKTVMA